jgi:hypothetical protein
VDNNLIAKILIFSVSIPCTLYIAYAAKVALNLNLNIFGAGHTPAKLEEISGGIIKCKWFPNPHHCPENNIKTKQNLNIAILNHYQDCDTIICNT